jgi:hypothetical protein
MELVAMVFGIVAVVGLLTALWPEESARLFLARWQRERLAGNWGGISWTGWVIFGFSAFTLTVMFILNILHR